MIIAKGQLTGRGGHVLRGDFILERRDTGVWMVTDGDFYFDGSPEPAFALSATTSPSENEARATRFLDLPGSGSLTGPQIEVRGKQEGQLPTSFDLVNTRSVFLWCFQTPFLLGIGEIPPVEANR